MELGSLLPKVAVVVALVLSLISVALLIRVREKVRLQMKGDYSHGDQAN